MSKSRLYQTINGNLEMNPSIPAVREQLLHLRSIVGRMGKYERNYWRAMLRLPEDSLKQQEAVIPVQAERELEQEDAACLQAELTIEQSWD